MNVGTKRQATRLLALAAATPVMVVMATGSAGAAPTVKHKLQGVAQTDVVQVSVNVPLGSTLASVLPSVANINLAKPLTIGLIHTEGSLARNEITKATDVATSTSRLASGTLFDKGGVLAGVNRTVTASLAHGTAAADGVAIDKFGLKVAVPTLTVKAIRSKADRTLATNGVGELAGLSFANLAQLLPAGALDQLNQLLTGSTDGNGTGGVLGQITGTLTGSGGLLDKIDKTLQTTPVGSAAHTPLTTLQKELQALQNALPKLVATLESGSVIDLKALDSGHNIGTTVGNAVSSTAHGALAHMSLLGGFVTLDGFNNSITATATGKANGAHAVINPNLAQVHIGSPVGLDLVLGPQGLTGGLLGSQLPTEITSLVNQLINQISDVLQIAGVKIAKAAYTTTYNKDRSAVSVAGSGLQVLVNNPLDRSNSDFNKALVGVKVGALAASAGDFAQASVTHNTLVHTTCTKACGPLPHTGANLPLTAGVAVAFLTGAYFVRRRFRITEA
ncbi:MAG: hypothetical protein ACJ735_16510 [Actinomycetes bacterium]